MNENKDDDEAREDPLRDLPEWLEEFNDNSAEEEASTTEAAGSLKPAIPELLYHCGNPGYRINDRPVEDVSSST